MPQTEGSGAGAGAHRLPSATRLAALALWALLCAVQAGWVPALRYAWALNFWQYFPDWLTPLMAAATGALCFQRIRSALVGACARIAGGLGRPPAPLLEALAFAALAGCFWLLRERQAYGDSYLLLAVMDEGWTFVFPEIGATFLMRWAGIALGALGLGLIQALQLSSCLLGALASLLVIRLSRDLAPAGGGRALVVAALVLSSGLLRIFAGHIEVYAAFLAGTCLYLGLALAHLHGRRSWQLTSFAAGVAVWIHLAALFLIPSLLLLPRLVDPELTRLRWLRRGLASLGLAAIPSLAFLLAATLVAPQEDLARAWAKALQVIGWNSASEPWTVWVRFRESTAPVGLGIDYVFLSLGHLKYLANSYYLLAPAALPVLLVFAIRAPRILLSTPAARLLAAAALPLMAYSILLRPIWGPFDWDLFAGAPLCLAALSAHLLARTLPRLHFEQLAVWLIGFQILYVAAPFLAMGVETPRRAGPFTRGNFYSEIGKQGDPPHGRIAPWL